MKQMPTSFKLANIHAESFNRLFDTVEPPININLIRKLRPDVTIVPVKLPIGANYKGYNRKNIDDTWDIFVNEDLPYPEQRMVVAHELGHVLFNQSMEDSRDSALVPGRVKAMNEHVVDQFAEAFMMPEKLFKKYWKKYNNDRDRLAQAFYVPIAAVDRRILTLGL
jgi:Zn-dependent peptidase ImmA (M78 family)